MASGTHRGERPEFPKRELFPLGTKKYTNVITDVIAVRGEKNTACKLYGGSGSVVSASEFKSEDPGFDPLAGQGMTASEFKSEDPGFDPLAGRGMTASEFKSEDPGFDPLAGEGMRSRVFSPYPSESTLVQP